MAKKKSDLFSVLESLAVKKEVRPPDSISVREFADLGINNQPLSRQRASELLSNAVREGKLKRTWDGKRHWYHL